MDPRKHAELFSFGFPYHIINYLEGYSIDETEVGDIIEFLQDQGILSIEEHQGSITFNFLDEDSLYRRVARDSICESAKDAELPNPARFETLKDNFLEDHKTTSIQGYVGGVPPGGSPTKHGDHTTESQNSFTVPGSQTLQDNSGGVRPGDLPVASGSHTTKQIKLITSPPGSATVQNDNFRAQHTRSIAGVEGVPPGGLTKQGGHTVKLRILATVSGSETLQDNATGVHSGDLPVESGSHSTKLIKLITSLPGTDTVQNDFLEDPKTTSIQGYVGGVLPGGSPTKHGGHTAESQNLFTVPVSQTLQDNAGGVRPGDLPVASGSHTTKQIKLITSPPRSDIVQNDNFGAQHTTSIAGLEGVPPGGLTKQGGHTVKPRYSVTVSGPETFQDNAVGVRPDNLLVESGSLSTKKIQLITSLPGSDTLQNDYFGDQETECIGGYVEGVPSGGLTKQGGHTFEPKYLAKVSRSKTLKSNAGGVSPGDLPVEFDSDASKQIEFISSPPATRPPKRKLEVDTTAILASASTGRKETTSPSNQHVSNPRTALIPLPTNIDKGTTQATIQLPASQRRDGENLQVSTVELTPNVLRGVLLNSLEGRAILDLARTGPLSEKRQLGLSGIIAKWHLENRQKVYSTDLKKYALAITSLFSYEKEETYFLPRTGDKKNPGGKIYSSITNTKTKKRNQEKDDQRQRDLNAADGKDCETTDREDEALLDALKWLQDNDEPWATVREYWKAIFPLRRRNVGTAKAKAELITCNLWRLFCSRLGYQLIDIDYQLTISKRSNGKWEHVISVAGPFIKQRAIDDQSERLVAVLQDKSASNDARLCALLLVLNCILPPAKVTKTYKPTVPNGQKDTIIFAQNDEDAKNKLTAVYAEYTNYGMSTTPKIVLFGNHFELTGIFRVYYEDLYYTLPTVARADDVYIKWVIVLGLKHSKISKLIWLFIQQYIYDQDIKEKYASIIKLIDYLNRCTPANNHEN